MELISFFIKNFSAETQSAQRGFGKLENGGGDFSWSQELGK